MNDGDLVQAVQAGDSSSLTILYQRHVKGVWRYFDARLSRDRQLTEDLLSETFLAAIRTIGAYDPKRGTVHGWLLGIAKNKLQDHFRKANRTVDGQTIQADEVADADSVDPDRRLITAEVKHAVARTLDAMQDVQRLVLEWKYIESLSVREIAQRLDRTEKAAQAVLYRARASFRAIHAHEMTRTE